MSVKPLEAYESLMQGDAFEDLPFDVESCHVASGCQRVLADGGIVHLSDPSTRPQSQHILYAWGTVD